jgi:peptide deformylase
MIRPIVLYGNEILELESTEVKNDPRISIQPIITDMFETMHKAKGIGLAAVQIGVPLRLFVIDAHIDSHTEGEEKFDFIGIFINPKILREFGTPIKHPEGCLSIPQLAALVERPSEIEMEWWDEKWEYHKQEFDGYAARIIQHEYDHLDGNLYVNRLDKMWKDMLERPLDLIKKRRMEVPYLWK